MATERASSPSLLRRDSTSSTWFHSSCCMRPMQRPRREPTGTSWDGAWGPTLERCRVELAAHELVDAAVSRRRVELAAGIFAEGRQCADAQAEGSARRDAAARAHRADDRSPAVVGVEVDA